MSDRVPPTESLGDELDEAPRVVEGPPDAPDALPDDLGEDPGELTEETFEADVAEARPSRLRAWRERRAARRAARQAAREEAMAADSGTESAVDGTALDDEAALQEEVAAAVVAEVPVEEAPVLAETALRDIEEVDGVREDEPDVAAPDVAELEATEAAPLEEPEATETAPVEEPEAAPGPRRTRDRPGRRQARQAQQRRRKRRRRIAIITGIIILAVAVVASVVALLVRAAIDVDGADEEAPGAATIEPPQTLLLIRRPEAPGPALSVSLLSGVAGEQQSSVVMLPIGTLMDIPGIGLERLGFAQQFGGAELVEAAVENELGINIDHTATVTDAGLTEMFARAGGFVMNVPDRLIRRHDDGSAEVTVEAGQRHLDGPTLAYYWAYEEEGEDEITRISRQQLLLDAFFSAAAEDDAFVDRFLAGGVAPFDTSADASFLRELLGRMAASHEEGRLKLQLLPVEPFGGPDETGLPAYRLERDQLGRMVSDLLSGSLPADAATRGVRVQILNGVGVPGIGQEVTDRLEGGGFRIVFSENAPHFEYPETQIVIYEETREWLEAARRVQERLGVGRIVVSRQPVSAVDLTIVVGHDFNGAAPPAS